MSEPKVKILFWSESQVQAAQREKFSVINRQLYGSLVYPVRVNRRWPWPLNSRWWSAVSITFILDGDNVVMDSIVILVFLTKTGLRTFAVSVRSVNSL